jgi:hypothetical protein
MKGRKDDSNIMLTPDRKYIEEQKKEKKFTRDLKSFFLHPDRDKNIEESKSKEKSEHK